MRTNPPTLHCSLVALLLALLVAGCPPADDDEFLPVDDDDSAGDDDDSGADDDDDDDTAVPGIEVHCDDGIDGDGDGPIDCADPDCGADPDCEDDVGCDGNIPIRCGQTWSGSLDDAIWRSQVAAWPCADTLSALDDLPAPEVRLQLTGSNDIDAVVTVTGDDGAWMLVLPGDASACQPGACEAVELSSSEEEVPLVFAAGQDRVQLIFDGESSNLAVSVTVECGQFVEVCDDGDDNDSNGLTDCDDPACSTTASCEATCATAELSMDEGDDSIERNLAVTATDVMDGYGCAGARPAGGRELGWTLQTNQDITCDFTLEADTNLDLYILPNEDCVAVDCALSSATPGTGNETLTVDILANGDPTLVVDGPEGSEGEFDLSWSCYLIEDCNDGVDDDGDALIDCADPDCDTEPICVDFGTCAPSAPLQCGDDATLTTGIGSALDLYTCEEGAWLGGEYTSLLPNPGSADGVLTVAVASVGGGDVDLFVLSGACNSAQCQAASTTPATGSEVLTVWSDGSTPLYVAVDTPLGGSGLPFDLAVTCGESAPCLPDAPLFCGVTASASTTELGATNSVDAWSCPGADATGAEYTFTFGPLVTGSHTFDLSNLGGEADVYVVSAETGVCAASGCLAAANEPGADSLTVELTANELYYVVVDSPSGGGGGFNLDVSCPVAG